MQIEFKGAHQPTYRKAQKHATVQMPGYVSTASWPAANDTADDTATIQKGRVTTPPPASAMGLHQLMREAFWLD